MSMVSKGLRALDVLDELKVLCLAYKGKFQTEEEAIYIGLICNCLEALLADVKDSYPKEYFDKQYQDLVMCDEGMMQ